MLIHIPTDSHCFTQADVEDVLSDVLHGLRTGQLSVESGDLLICYCLDAGKRSVGVYTPKKGYVAYGSFRFEIEFKGHVDIRLQKSVRRRQIKESADGSRRP